MAILYEANFIIGIVVGAVIGTTVEHWLQPVAAVAHGVRRCLGGYDMETLLHDETPLTAENIKKLTLDLIGFHNAEDMWNEGWRPVFEDRTGDILFMSPLDSYVRARGSERSGNASFDLLGQALSMKQIVPVVMWEGSPSRYYAARIKDRVGRENGDTP